MSSGIEFEEDSFSKGYSQARSSQSASSYDISQSSYSDSEVQEWLVG